MIGFKVNLFEIDEHQQAWGMLDKSRVDFYIDDFEAIKLYAKLNNLDLDQYHIKVILNDFIYIALSQNTKGQHLAALYDKHMPSLLLKGDIDKIYQQYGYENPLTSELLKTMQDKCELKSQLK